MMIVEETRLPGVLLVKPKLYGDSRGFFMETFNEGQYSEQGIPEDGARLVQDNYSRSARGVLRGLHFQRKFPQGKLVQVVNGAVFDVAVDIRPGSSTFGKWVGMELSEDNRHQLWVPPGFAHGFCVLSEVADFQYKCTDFYHPEDEGGIIWNDSEIGIEWPLENPLLSAKDQANPCFKDAVLWDNPSS